MWESKQFLCEMVNDMYIYDKSIKNKMDSIIHKYDENSECEKVFFDVTNRCNINCEHCFTSAKSNSSINEMNIYQIKDMFTQLAGMNVKRIALGGGEPLVRKDIYEIIKYGTDLGIRIHMSSNGLLLNEENIIKLKESGIDSIQISIDSSKNDIHDKFRGCPGLFDKCLEAIKLIQKYKIPLIISTTISKININEIDEIIKFIKGLGVKMHRFIRFVPVGRGETYKNMLYVEPNELIPKIIETRNKFKEYYYGDLNYVYGFPINKNKLRNYSDANGCEGGKGCVDILPNGDIVPCNYLGFEHDWIGGNVLEQPVRKVINNSNEILYFKNQKGKNVKGCSNCELNNSCGKGCRAVAYNYSGNECSRDPICDFIRGVYK